MLYLMASPNYNHKSGANHHPMSGHLHHTLSQPQQHQHAVQGHHQPQGLFQSSASSSSIPTGNFIGKDAPGAYDLGELDQALFLYFDGHDPTSTNVQEQRHQSGGMRPPTLNIFPSQPMHVVEPSSHKGSMGGLVVNSPSNSGSKRPTEPSIELTKTRSEAAPPEATKTIKKEGSRKGAASSYSEQDGPRTPDPKTLRRLAQNREAARKSRLRKKAYIQQLETSRIKLTQLEQELQRDRAQGLMIGGGGLLGHDQSLLVGISSITSDAAAMFDMEYGRWLEEHHRLMCELRAAVQEHLPENELRLFVDNCLAHYDEMMGLKSMVAKSDVFHLVSGMWKTPAERCFMWMGGFRPSELIKVVLSQIEPLSGQQILGICGLQQSTQETEEALSQGLDALNQSLTETITSDSLSCPPNMANYMAQMSLCHEQALHPRRIRQAGRQLETPYAPPAAPDLDDATGCEGFDHDRRVFPAPPSS